MGQAKAVAFHAVSAVAVVGLAGGQKVGGRGVGEAVKAFYAFGYAVDIKVVGVDDAYFVVVAEVGIAARLGEEVETEGGVVPLDREHAQQGRSEVCLHGEAVKMLRTEPCGVMEYHGDVVVGEGHVVAVGAPNAAVVGNEYEEGVGVPGLEAGHAQETPQRPVGILYHLFVHVAAAGFERRALGYGVGGVVAAGHDDGEEWALGGGLVAVAQGIVEHDVVGYTPGADNLGRGVAVLPDDAVEAVAEEESAHVVEVLVVCHEIGCAVAGVVEDLGKPVDYRDDGLFHGMARGDAGARIEGGIDAVVGVDAGGIGTGEDKRLGHEAVEAGGE